MTKSFKKNFIQNTALIQRNLTLSSKSFIPYLIRIILPIGFILLLSAQQPGMFEITGLEVMALISVFNMIVITFYSFLAFSTVISSESENKTLTLLKLTPLNSFSLLMGKLAGPYINIFIFMLLQIPFVLLAVTLGGVSTTEILKIYFVLIMYMNSMAAVALFCSVRNNENWLACLSIIALYFMSFAIPGLLYGLGYEFKLTILRDLGIFLMETSTFHTVFELFKRGPDNIYFHTGINLTVCMAFIYLAYKSFNMYSDDVYVKPLKQDKKTKVKIAKRFSGLNPLADKDARVTFGGRPSQIIIFVAMLAVIIFSIGAAEKKYFGAKQEYVDYFKVFFPMHLAILAGFFIHYSGYAVKSELTNKTMGSLLLTSMTNRQLFTQKLLAIFKFMKPHLLFILVTFLINPKTTFLCLWQWLTEYKILWLTIPAIILLGALNQLLQISKLGGHKKDTSSIFIAMVFMAVIAITIPDLERIDSILTSIMFMVIIFATWMVMSVSCKKLTYLE